MTNIEVVHACYAEFGKGNPQGVLALLHNDITWIDPGFPFIPYGGKRKGKDEVLKFFMEMGGTVTFTRFEPKEFMRDGDNVIVRGFFTGKGNAGGRTFESEWVMIWKVEGGRVRHYQAFIDTHNVGSALN